jgi:predicted RNA binding protein YcfA (HicA-like mRNA interferase family)
MSKLAKLVASFLAEPAEVDFADVERLLREFGFQLTMRRGSHNVFRHPDDGRKLTVPTVGGRRVKRVYVRKIVELLDLEKWHGEE